MTDKELKIWTIGYLKGTINTLKEMEKITKWQAEDIIAALNLINSITKEEGE